MSAPTASKRPIKGILKNKGCTASSVAAPAQQSGGPRQVRSRKSERWDESNIVATSRSAYRDYESMKINEPGTPRVRIQDGGEDLDAKNETGDTTVDVLAVQIAATGISEPSCQMGESENKETHSSKIFLSSQEKRRQFELKRKLYYSKGLNIKLGRELIAKDLQYEEIDDETKESPPATNEKKTAVKEPDDELQSWESYM